MMYEFQVCISNSTDAEKTRNIHAKKETLTLAQNIPEPASLQPHNFIP